MPVSADSTHQPHPSAPRPLLIAALMTVLQSVAALIMGLLEVASFSGQRAAMGVTTAIFFIAYGAFLIIAARQLTRLSPWARGPVLLAQLIWLGVAWSFRGGGTTWLAVILAASALVALWGLLHPDSRAALD